MTYCYATSTQQKNSNICTTLVKIFNKFCPFKIIATKLFCILEYPLYFKLLDGDLFSICSFIALRIVSSLTSFESLTTFKRCSGVIKFNRTSDKTKTELESSGFFFNHSCTPRNTLISNAQNVSREINSMTTF